MPMDLVDIGLELNKMEQFDLENLEVNICGQVY